MATKNTSSEGNGKIVLILLWLIWPVGLIWYLVDENIKKDAFVKFHFKQWLVALIAVVIGAVASGILMMVLIGFITYFLVVVLGIVWFIQSLIHIIKGEEKELWLIGKYAAKFKF